MRIGLMSGCGFFEYTSQQCNRNTGQSQEKVACDSEQESFCLGLVHTDRNNMGASDIIKTGNFTGGTVWMYGLVIIVALCKARLDEKYMVVINFL